MSAHPPQHSGRFTTTHWSALLCAGREESPQAVAALEQFRRTYWYPLNVFARRSGLTEHEAQDATARQLAGKTMRLRLLLRSADVYAVTPRPKP